MAAFYLLLVLESGAHGPGDPTEVQNWEKWIGRMAVLGLWAGALGLISGCVWALCRWLGLRSKGHGPITIEKSLTQ